MHLSLKPVNVWLSVALLTIGITLNLLSVHVFPIIQLTDEPWYLSYTDTFAQTGRSEASMVPEYSPGQLMGPLYIHPATWLLRVLNGDRFALRLFSTLAGLLLLAVIFFIGWMLDSRVFGLQAAALLSVNLLWISASHVGRADLWMSVFVWAGIALLLLARKKNRLWMALSAGLMLSLSISMHPIGGLSCVAAGVWWLLDWRNAIKQRRLLILFVIGGLFGTGFFFITNILPSPTAFFQNLGHQVYSDGASGFQPFAAALYRHVYYSNPLELLFLLFCMGISLLGKGPARSIARFVLIQYLLYLFLIADPNLYYMVAWIPGCVLLSTFAMNRSLRWRWAVILVVFLNVSFNGIQVINHVRENWNERALAALNGVKDKIPAESTVLADPLFYMVFRESRFVAYTYIDSKVDRTQMSEADAIFSLHPDILIVSSGDEGFSPLTIGMNYTVPVALKTRDQIPVNVLSAYRLGETVQTELGTIEIWQRKQS